VAGLKQDCWQFLSGFARPTTELRTKDAGANQLYTFSQMLARRAQFLPA
jgi:hypothetical protein